MALIDRLNKTQKIILLVLVALFVAADIWILKNVFFYTPEFVASPPKQVAVGKVVRTLSNGEKIAYSSSVAVPIPKGKTSFTAYIKASALVSGDRTMIKGQTDPIFKVRVVSSAYLQEKHVKNVLAETYNVWYTIGEGVPIEFQVDKTDDQLYLLVTVDDLKVAEYPEYHINIGVDDRDRISSFLITQFDSTNKTFEWVTMSGRIDVVIH